jgi:hypothetical protein
MRALYADLSEDGTWLRPSELDAQVCADEVQNMRSDYALACDRLEHAATIYGDTQFAVAVEAITNRPTIPPIPNISLEAALRPSKAGPRK